MKIFCMRPTGLVCVFIVITFLLATALCTCSLILFILINNECPLKVLVSLMHGTMHTFFIVIDFRTSLKIEVNNQIKIHVKLYV